MVEIKLFVTLVGTMVAVADTKATAERQIGEIVHNFTGGIVDDARDNGEMTRSLKIRVAHVTLNQ
jgi:hypothetical protein